jgi:hypothetical protein
MVAWETAGSLVALSNSIIIVTLRREAHENGQQAKLLPRSETTVGWISRKLSTPVEAELFFLTPLLIEFIDRWLEEI